MPMDTPQIPRKWPLMIISSNKLQTISEPIFVCLFKEMSWVLSSCDFDEKDLGWCPDL